MMPLENVAGAIEMPARLYWSLLGALAFLFLVICLINWGSK